MNIRYYRDYKMHKSKWYLIAYHFVSIDGKSGVGSIELNISGTPDLNAVGYYIKENNPDIANAIVLNVMHTHKSLKPKNKEGKER